MFDAHTPQLWMNDFDSFLMTMVVFFYVLFVRALIIRIKCFWIRGITSPLFAASLATTFGSVMLADSLFPAFYMIIGVFYLSVLPLELDYRYRDEREYNCFARKYRYF